jgi:hypothetical protein
MLQNIDISFQDTYAGFSNSCPGYFDQTYLYLTPSWNTGRNFCLEPVENNPATIEERTEVFIKATYDSLYLAKTASGLVTGRRWDADKSDEFLVCQVRNIKAEQE